MSLDSNVVYLGFLSLYVYVSILMLFIFDSRLFMSMSTSMSLYVYVYVSILMSTILVSLCLRLCVYSNVVYLQFLSLCHLSLNVYVYVFVSILMLCILDSCRQECLGILCGLFKTKKRKNIFSEKQINLSARLDIYFYYIGVNITECWKSYISIQEKYI